MKARKARPTAWASTRPASKCSSVISGPCARCVLQRGHNRSRLRVLASGCVSGPSAGLGRVAVDDSSPRRIDLTRLPPLPGRALQSGLACAAGPSALLTLGVCDRVRRARCGHWCESERDERDVMLTPAQQWRQRRHRPSTMACTRPSPRPRPQLRRPRRPCSPSRLLASASPP